MRSFSNGWQNAKAKLMFHDFRYAFRALRQNPGFALTAIISIALAIGANSAIFSMADGLLFRPISVPNAAQVVSIRARTPSGGFGNVSYADFADFRENARSFDGLVAGDLIPSGFARDPQTQTQLKMGYLVSGNFFQILGIEPRLGRRF